MRDVDVLAEAARRADVGVTFSVPTLDEEVWRTTEPARRRRASGCARCGRSSTPASRPASAWRRSCPGSPTGPSSSRGRAAAREAGATGVWANLLYLRPGTREHFLEHLARDWPEQLARYEALYAARAYLKAETAKPVRETVSRARAAASGSPTGARSGPSRAASEQLALAV